MIDLYKIQTIFDLEQFSTRIMGMNIHYSQKRLCIEKATQKWLSQCSK
ncbi:hypothetical protein ABKY47_002102 [Aeromonas hydrophila]